MKPEHAAALRDGIVGALEAGLDNGGASIDDYRDARGVRGSMQDEFLVHRREGEECLRCGGTIQRIVVSGRSTYYCPGCQVRLRRRPTAPNRRRGTRSGEAPVRPPEGFAVGHWTDPEGLTGCTVVLAPPGSRGGVCVQGGGPGTRETDSLGPLANAEHVTAVLLTGGSAFGLAAADGVVRWCEEHGRGYETPAGLVPIVPAAVIYDLASGDPGARPGPEQGYAACEARGGGRARAPARSAPGPGRWSASCSAASAARVAASATRRSRPARARPSRRSPWSTRPAT